MVKLRANIQIIGGFVLMLIVIVMASYIFSVTKVGPIGNGTHHWTIYVSLYSSFFIGLFSLLSGLNIKKHR